MAITDDLPNFGIEGFSGAIRLIAWLGIGTLLLIIAGALAYWYFNNKKYDKRIVILEDVAGSDDLEIVGRDKATLVKMGQSGMEILYLQKRKKYLGAYGKRMGKNIYNFAIGPDGYWYNITLGGLTEGLEKVKIKPTNVNMRYQNEGLMQTIKDRYNAVTFMQKYGGLIAYVLLILITMIMIYLLFDKFIEISSTINRGIDAAALVQEETKKIIGALDSLKASGGIQSA
jgi:hypothetical protein